MDAIDTNVLLRYLLHDDELQARKATTLINGDQFFYISQVVLAETAWTLTGKKYKVTPKELHQTILALFSEENLIFQEPEIVWKTLSDYKTYRVENGNKIDFPDILIYRAGQDAADGRPVGTLKDEQGQWAFTYDRSWLSFDKTYALSPHLPLQEDPLVDNSSQRQVQWYFDNLLPEEGQRIS